MPETEEEQEPEQQISENPDNSGQTVDNTAGETEETSDQAEDNQKTDEEEVLPNEVHYDDGNTMTVKMAMKHSRSRMMTEIRKILKFHQR